MASQTHCPVALHSSPAGQAAQLAPAVPQVPVFGSWANGMHVPVEPPLQHPFGQVLASHAHAPSVVSQSTVVLTQDTQAFPPVPQRAAVCAVGSSQLLPLQQPVGHEFESQTHWPPALHSCPAGHAAHAAPPVPQVLSAASPAYLTQAPVALSQQPIGQELESQTHALPLHSWPLGHAAHDAPLAPHWPFPSAVGWTQLPLLQQPGQLLLPPHEHAPAVQVSPVPQAAQAAPTPHCVLFCADTATQVPSVAQQPAGHEVAVHTHCPAALHA